MTAAARNEDRHHRRRHDRRDGGEVVRQRGIEAIGFGAVDTGSLVEGGRRQQPGAPLYNQVITVRDAHLLVI